MTYALIEELFHVHKAPIEQLQVEAKEFEKTFKAHYGISDNTFSWEKLYYYFDITELDKSNNGIRIGT